MNEILGKKYKLIESEWINHELADESEYRIENRMKYHNEFSPLKSYHEEKANLQKNKRKIMRINFERKMERKYEKKDRNFIRSTI